MVVICCSQKHHVVHLKILNDCLLVYVLVLCDNRTNRDNRI